MKRELQQLVRQKNRKTLPNILLVAAECSPISKTGGLADVVGTLPKAFSRLGADARVMTPYHKVVKEKYGDRVEHLMDFYVELGWRHAYVGVEKLVLDGVTIYLIDNEQYFARIYYGGDAEGEQYAFFCRAVLEAMPKLDFVPEVVHCNDWHTAMMPLLAHTQYEGQLQDRCRYLFTIHNLAFQGKYDFGFVQDLLNVDSKYYTSKFMEFYGCADFLKGGLIFADKINTVSPSYAAEICTPEYGEGLEGVLNERREDLSGIINGIDTVFFDPSSDPVIPFHYSAGRPGNKKKAKEALQQELGLNEEPEIPVFAMVTRMTEQKGFDLMEEILEELLLEEAMQFVLVGSGDTRFEESMTRLQERYPGRVSVFLGYNEPLSHRVYAGSDFYIMPSRFEPCGLSQMIAMRYGTVPVVRRTGGLKDTVAEYNDYTGEGTGFTFNDYDSQELKEAIRKALWCWKDRGVMNSLMKNDMSSDFSFDLSALEYMRLYLCML